MAGYPGRGRLVLLLGEAGVGWLVCNYPVEGLDGLREVAAVRPPNLRSGPRAASSTALENFDVYSELCTPEYISHFPGILLPAIR